MAYAFLWDMDGTLVDSYPAIVPAVQEVCDGLGLNFPPELIYEQIIQTSVGSFLEALADRLHIDPAPLKQQFNARNDSRADAVRAMPHAKEILEILTGSGHPCFVVTHRGASCHVILEKTGLEPYFTEIVTALNGFPRKPAPDSILYLIRKYSLNPSQCFYVGDRSLDIAAANNAGVQSILFLDPAAPGAVTGQETYVVSDLLEIQTITENMG